VFAPPSCRLAGKIAAERYVIMKKNLLHTGRGNCAVKF
jgi:hypothetical protein